MPNLTSLDLCAVIQLHQRCQIWVQSVSNWTNRGLFKIRSQNIFGSLIKDVVKTDLKKSVICGICDIFDMFRSSLNQYKQDPGVQIWCEQTRINFSSGNYRICHNQSTVTVRTKTLQNYRNTSTQVRVRARDDSSVDSKLRCLEGVFFWRFLHGKQSLAI